MDTESSTQYQQVTVDVPEDRLAEFHALFARFLAGPIGRGRRGRHGGPQRHGRGHGCRRHHEAPETGQAAEITEV
jgi:hypothetical protein